MPNLESIALPNITTVDDGAFSWCDKLTTVNFPKVKVIGEEAFKGCTSLKNIEMPNLTKIGDSAFQNCSSIERISLKKTKEIGYGAFDKCESLSYVEFGNDLEVIADRVFVDCPLYKFIIFPNLKSIKIGSNAFGYLSSKEHYGA